MNRFIAISVFLLISCLLNAQALKKNMPTHSKIGQTTKKKLSDSTLYKQIQKLITESKYEEAIKICNVLHARNVKDSNVILVRSSLKARLGKDDEAIADIKKFILNKDTAANIISYLPILAEFNKNEKSGELYYKAAIAYSPKLGLPYFFYGGELSDKGEHAKALEYANIGFPLLSKFERQNFISSYAKLFYAANFKNDAYKILDSVIKINTNDVEVNTTYLFFLREDQRYEEAISMADRLFAKDSVEDYLFARFRIYKKMDNSIMMCKDAALLEHYFKGYDGLALQSKCVDKKAEIFPTSTTSYVYLVETPKSVYNFTITNPKVAMDSGISFNWKMGIPVNKEGKVIISKEAVNSAYAQLNNFGAKDVYTTDRTSVWISNAVYNQIKMDGKTFIKSGNDEGKTFLVDKNVENLSVESIIDMDYETNFRVGWVNLIHIKSEDGIEEYWINDDPKNPIIVKMILAPFSITLKEIKTK